MPKTSQFEYLLNAMEHAAKAKNPIRAGYAVKRAAVLAHVEQLEQSLRSYQADAACLDWLERAARSEVKITLDASGADVWRWCRRYISFHAWRGKDVRAALRRAAEVEEHA